LALEIHPCWRKKWIHFANKGERGEEGVGYRILPEVRWTVLVVNNSNGDHAIGAIHRHDAFCEMISNIFLCVLFDDLAKLFKLCIHCVIYDIRGGLKRTKERVESVVL